MDDDMTRRERQEEEIGKTMILFVVIVIGISFLPAVLLGLIVHAILVKILKREWILYTLAGIAGIAIAVLFEIGKIVLFFGYTSAMNIPYISTGIERLMNNGNPIPINVYSFFSLLCLSFLSATGIHLYEKFFMKKQVHSKKSKLDEQRTSTFYQKFRENRLNFLNSEQVKFRKKQSKEYFIGYTDLKERVFLDEKELNQHILLTGTTGSGKTTVIGSLIESAIINGKPVIFVDGKGERKTILEIKSLCEAYGKKVHIFSDLDTMTYNPLKHGSPTVIRDKLMNLFEWSEPYYKNQCSRFLQLLVKMLAEYKKPRDLQTIYSYLDERNLAGFFNENSQEIEIEVEGKDEEETGEEKEDGFASALFGEEKKSNVKTAPKKKKKKKQKVRIMDDNLKVYFEKFFNEIDLKAVSNLRNQVAELLESDLGHLFEEKSGGLDLRTITDQNEIVIFSLSGNKYKDYIRTLGRLVVMEVNSLVDYRFKVGKKSIFAVYDEFSAYANHEIVDIVNKSRSAGFECLISTQGLSDIDTLDPTLTRQILNNVNTYCFGRVNEPSDAEKIAEVIGTYEDFEMTNQTQNRNGRGKHFVSDMGTSREVQRFKAHPDEIKNLQVGEVFLCRKTKEENLNQTYVRRVYVRNSLDLKGLEKLKLEGGSETECSKNGPGKSKKSHKWRTTFKNNKIQ